MNLAFWKAKLAALGAALLALGAVILRIQYLKQSRDNMRNKANVLEARVHVQRVEKKIKREEERRLLAKEESLKKELSKEGKDFEGVDVFTNPNDF